MTSEQSRRVGRCYQWGVGSCLALALAAGTTMAQQQEQPKPDQTPEQESVQVTGEDLQIRADLEKDQEKKEHGAILATGEPQKDEWKSAQTLPIKKDLVLSGKTGDDKDVHIFYTGGRLSSATVNEQNIQHDKIKFKQHEGKGKIKVLKAESDEELITFMIPQQVLAMGADTLGPDGDRFEQQRFGTMEQNWQQDQFRRENNLRHDRLDQGVDYYHDRNWDVHEFQDRRQNFGDDRSWDRDQRMDRQNWDNRWDSQRTEMRFERNQPQFQRDSRFDMRDDRMMHRDDRMMHRTETYGPSRYEAQQFRGEMRSPDRFETRSTQTFRPDDRFESRQTFRSDMPQSYRSETRMYSTGDKPTLGVQVREVHGQELRSITREYQSGLRIQRVQRGGLADHAGLRPGDVIVRIDGRPADPELLRDALENKARMGDDLRLTIVRDNQTRTIAVTPMRTTQRFGTGEFIPERPSTLEHFRMPNVQHPGDSSYSPSGDFRSDRRIYSTDRDVDVRFDRRYDTGRDRDLEIRYDRDTRFDREFDVRYDRDFDRDRNMRIEQRWDSNYDRDMYRDSWRDDRRDLRSRTWDTDVHIDRPDTRFEARSDMGRNRIYGTTDVDTFDTTVYDRDVIIRDRTIDGRLRDRSYLDLEMPNVQHPGPYNVYRPTLPEEGPRR